MPTDLFATLDDLPPIDPEKDYYEELVGPGKKYADQKAFGRSRVEADIHIARLEDEQKRLRQELTTRLDYETFLDQLKKTPIAPSANPPVESPKDLTGMKTEDIERLLEQKIQQREIERSSEQNLNAVDRKLTETLGPNYAQHLKRQAVELGVSEQFIRNLAATNPKALYRLIGLDEKPSKDNFFQAPPKSEFSFTGTPSSSKRGDAYYEDIRKKDPNLYWTPKIQNEIFDRIKEVGAETFYSS